MNQEKVERYTKWERTLPIKNRIYVFVIKLSDISIIVID